MLTAPVNGGRWRVQAARWRAVVGDPRILRWLSVAVTCSIVALVGTGAWVRLSQSGLGCPTWPDCTATTLVAPPQYHALVEFINRCVITIVGVLVVATALAAFAGGRRLLATADEVRGVRWLSLGLVVGYLGEAVLGGVTVLLKLAPSLVASHLILAMLILADAVVLQWRASPRTAGRRYPLDRHLVWLTDLLLVAVGFVVAAGTVVAGSGPHSGAPGTPRFGFPFAATAELHSLEAMFLCGLTVALGLGLLAAGAPRPVVRVAETAVVLLVVQGALGYATFFSHVQVDVAEAHILGAAVVFVTLLRLRLGVRRL